MEATPRRAAGRDYDLSACSDEQRDALTFLLGERGIPYRWRQGTLVVGLDRRAEVDQLLGSLTGDRSPEASPSAGRPPPPPSLPVSIPKGWHRRTDGQPGWDWWDGTAWSAYGGGPPPPGHAAPPGWYDDPWRLRPRRWWDGGGWTGDVDDGVEERPWLPHRGPGDTGAVAGLWLVAAGIVAALAVGVGLEFALSFAGFGRYSLAREVIPQLGLWSMLIGACLAAVHRYGHGSLRELGLARLTTRDLPVGLLGAWIARTGAAVITLTFVPVLPKNLQSSTGLVNELRSSTITIIVVGAIVVIGAPIVEELFFRGLTQSAFTRRFGARVGLFATAACFGAVHYQVGMGLAEAVLTFLVIGSTGLVLGVLRAHYQRLGPGMVAHGCFNVIALVGALAAR